VEKQPSASPSSIDAGRARVLAAGHRCDRYAGVWLLVLAVLILLRAAHLVATPWRIVLAPLWFPPALFVSYRITKNVLGLVLIFLARVLLP
jgi:hypothetical protein